MLYTDVDEADEPELQALVDEEEALPTAQQLAEEASEEAIEAEMEAQDRGEVSTEDAGAEEFSTEDE